MRVAYPHRRERRKFVPAGFRKNRLEALQNGIFDAFAYRTRARRALAVHVVNLRRLSESSARTAFFVLDVTAIVASYAVYIEYSNRRLIAQTVDRVYYARLRKRRSLTLRDTIYYVTRSKLGEPTLLVLASLISAPKHGYAIICDIERHTGRRLGPGTLYGIITRLEKSRFIKAMELQERGRRPYCVTAAGKRAFEQDVQILAQYQRALRALAGG